MAIIPNIAYWNSPVGLLRLQQSALGLERIDFVNSISDPEQQPEALTETIDQLDNYFSGHLNSFTIPIHLIGTPFQENVWKELMLIPFGKVISYETLARQLGDIKVIRAAATANGKNPIPIVVPCHRVVGKDGSLTGYSGGLWRKQWLLEHESKELRPRMFG